MTTRASAARPRALAPGARVALVAPGGPPGEERIANAVARCRSLGLEPVMFPSIAVRHRYLAGTDAQRLVDLQTAFDDLGIDAIWALRGGYGSTRIVHLVDLQRQCKAPIPFIGFSDNTSLHVRHAAMGVISFHGPHPGGDFPPETEQSFRDVLFSAEPAGALRSRPGDPRPRPLVEGRVEAPLVGGNLSLIAALCGTSDALSARGRILFLEEIGEPAYRVDRMLLQLERAGVTDGVVGLAFGRFTNVPDAELHPVIDAVTEFAEHVRVPAVAELPFGHVEHNCTLPVGARALLDGGEASLSIVEPAVQARE
ncbi:MAG: S66 peptidase family protein [Longimicrobiales bacterium]